MIRNHRFVIFSLFVGAFLIFFNSISMAWDKIQNNTLYDLSSKSSTQAPLVAESISPGDVIILSELHDNLTHHQHQLEFLQILQRKIKNTDPATSTSATSTSATSMLTLPQSDPPNMPSSFSIPSLDSVGVSVGMEFFSYVFQNWVDLFLNKEISESVFLDRIQWSNNNFDFYRDLVLLPIQSRGWTFAANAPRELTSKVKKFGLHSLTEEEKKWLPPNFELGNSLYFERFRDLMIESGHSNLESIQRYFEAQSIWDDTMAWSIHQYAKAHPQQILVFIVGDFHAIYGGGLPDRIRNRGMTRLHVISQIHLENAPEDPELQDPKEADPREADPKYGFRADYIWTD